MDVSEYALSFCDAGRRNGRDPTLAGKRRDLAAVEDYIPTEHCHSQRRADFFNQTGLLKRHDYDVEISGNSPAAH